MSPVFKAPRYSDRPFPPYAHRLGRTPHPITDPAGHSYTPARVGPPAAPPVEPAAWRASEEYLYGCDLYNHGFWWEAHESWEAIWHAIGREGPQARFMQGLIQAGACALQLERGRPEGVERLLARATEHLAEAGADGTYMGLDVRRWSARVSAYYAGRQAHDPAAFPYIELAM